MTDQEMKALQEMMRETVREELDTTLDKKLDEKLQPIHEKLDEMAFQLDTVYKWVDRIDIDVKGLKKAQ